MTDIMIPVAAGELIDKLTILRIKSERITDEQKLANVRHEMALLTEAAVRSLPPSPELTALWDELFRINSDLWQIEDDIRDHERRSDFGHGFIGLARSIYVTNDRRAEVKKAINRLLGSDIVEEKSYSDYGSAS